MTEKCGKHFREKNRREKMLRPAEAAAEGCSETEWNNEVLKRSERTKWKNER